jgi:hypothetical protein
MALFARICVLRGFPAAAYRRTPHRKPLCGLDPDKNCSFLKWTPIVLTLVVPVKVNIFLNKFAL